MILDKNFKLIYKFLTKNYGNAISFSEFDNYCDKHKIYKKEIIEILFILIQENSIAVLDNNSFVPLLSSKKIYNIHKQELRNKWHPILIAVVTSVVTSFLTSVLTILLTMH